MSDSINPIRYTPQVNRLNPKGKTGDKKDDKDSRQGFSSHMSANDKDVKGNAHNPGEERNSAGRHKKEENNSLQTEKACDRGETCGTILDTEV